MKAFCMYCDSSAMLNEWLMRRRNKYMQDRYVGDIGDFVKYALLRAVAYGKSLGVA